MAGGGSLAFVAAHIVGFGEDGDLKGAVYGGGGGAGGKTQGGDIERVELEEIAVRTVAFRRVWAAVAWRAETVLAADADSAGLVALREGVDRGGHMAQ